MKILKTIMYLLCLVQFTNCSKSKLPGDYFIFGLVTESSDFYMIKNEKLFKARKGSDKFFETIKMPHAKYLVAKKVLDSLPSGLTEGSRTKIGEPYIRDQGGVRIIKKADGNIKQWDIDYDISKLSAPFKTYILLIDDVMVELRKN